MPRSRSATPWPTRASAVIPQPASRGASGAAGRATGGRWRHDTRPRRAPSDARAADRDGRRRLDRRYHAAPPAAGFREPRVRVPDDLREPRHRARTRARLGDPLQPPAAAPLGPRLAVAVRARLAVPGGRARVARGALARLRPRHAVGGELDLPAHVRRA